MTFRETTPRQPAPDGLERYYAWRPVTAYLYGEARVAGRYPRTFRVWREWIWRKFEGDWDGGSWTYYVKPEEVADHTGECLSPAHFARDRA